MNTSTKSNNFFASDSGCSTASEFYDILKSGRGAIISHVIPEDISIDRKFVAVLDEQSGAYNMEVEQVTVMIEHGNVRQYLNTLEVVSEWLAIEFPEVSMKAEQHGYDIEFTLTRNLYK